MHSSVSHSNFFKGVESRFLLSLEPQLDSKLKSCSRWSKDRILSEGVLRSQINELINVYQIKYIWGIFGNSGELPRQIRDFGRFGDGKGTPRAPEAAEGLGLGPKPCTGF